MAECQPPVFEIDLSLQNPMGSGSVQDLNSSVKNLEETAEEFSEHELGSIPEEERNISILVLGKTGTGKSSLIASLLTATGASSPKVKHGIVPEKHDTVEVFEGTPNCFSQKYASKLTMCDTNGIRRQSFTESFWPLSKTMGKEISNCLRQKKIVPDLIFICISLDERFEEFPDVSDIAATLSYEMFWRRTVIMLTKANALYEKVEDVTKWKTAIQSSVPHIQQALLKDKIKKETMNKIPFVCIGQAVSTKDDNKANNWIGNLLKTCHELLGQEEKKMVFLNFAKAFWMKTKYKYDLKLQNIRTSEESSPIYTYFIEPQEPTLNYGDCILTQKPA